MLGKSTLGQDCAFRFQHRKRVIDHEFAAHCCVIKPVIEVLPHDANTQTLENLP